jgi:flagellar assembly protein FliH
MSLSNHSEKIAENKRSWTGFEMDSFEPLPLSEKEDKADFISLRIGEGGKGDFIPLEEGEDNYKKRKKTEDILKDAHQKAALLEREAYEKGFAQGEKDGLELGEKKAIKVIENIENLFIEIHHLKKEILKQYEKRTLELIFTIAKKIIHDQIELDEKAIKNTVFKALNLTAEKTEIILRVNPEDFDFVERLRPEFFTKFKELKSIIVTSDPSITRGGCFLETACGDVDATVETQLEKIYQSLEGVRKLET